MMIAMVDMAFAYMTAIPSLHTTTGSCHFVELCRGLMEFQFHLNLVPSCWHRSLKDHLREWLPQTGD